MRLPHTTELGKETGGTPVLRRTPTESGHGRDARATKLSAEYAYRRDACSTSIVEHRFGFRSVDFHVSSV